MGRQAFCEAILDNRFASDFRLNFRSVRAAIGCAVLRSKSNSVSRNSGTKGLNTSWGCNKKRPTNYKAILTQTTLEKIYIDSDLPGGGGCSRDGGW